MRHARLGFQVVFAALACMAGAAFAGYADDRALIEDL